MEQLAQADSAEQRPTGTVARISELIRYLAEQDGEVAVTTLARDLSLPPSTAHRLLHLLMDQGFVERGERFQSYRVGGELYRLGCLVSRKLGFAEMADPIMRGLSAESGEFSMLTLYLPSEHKLTLVHTVASPNPLTYRPELFSQLSIAWGASGRAILASLCDNEIREIYLKTGPSPVTGAHLPPYPEFRDDLKTIAARGFARTNAQRMAGAVGMASPVRNAAGKPVGSLCLTIPEFRFDAAREPELGAILRERASALSHMNGGMRMRAAF